jgi:hypothetical protein
MPATYGSARAHRYGHLYSLALRRGLWEPQHRGCAGWSIAWVCRPKAACRGTFAALGGASGGCWGVAAWLKVLKGQMGLMGQWLGRSRP